MDDLRAEVAKWIYEQDTEKKVTVLALLENVLKLNIIEWKMFG